MKSQKVIYFNDELNDEFFAGNVKTKIIDEKYKYINNNWLYKIVEFVFYRLMILPVAFIYCKIVKQIKFVNKKCLKQIKGGAFIYANHTNGISDAFSPNIICQPKKPYIIVNSQNVNVPILKGSTKMLGALPLPSNLEATKHFMDAIEKRLDNGNNIIIYPEAHIWPYYTKIRPFVSTSFKYPIKFNKPVFCFTTTYQRKGKNGYKMIIYIDGPFYENKEIESIKDRQTELRNRVFETMVNRSENSNFEKIKYIKKEEESND